MLPLSPRSWMKFFLFILALMPLSFSWAFRFVPTYPQTVTQAPERASLVFDQYLVNLGKVPVNRFVSAYFRFTNQGAQPVTITKLEPSCGCLQPRLKKKDYQPGDVGEFDLRVDTALREAGAQEFSLTVHYENPKPHAETLTFKFELPEQKVIVRPRALAFYQLGSQSTTQEIAVTDFRPDPLNITGIDCKSPYVQAEIAEQRIDHDGSLEHIIRITVAAEVPPNTSQTLLKIHTDDPKYHTLHVPLLIQGKNAARIRPASRKVPRHKPGK